MRTKFYGMDELDRKLIELLKSDGRTSNVHLARTLDISEKTVRNRIEKLRDVHGLRVTAELPDAMQGCRMIYLINTAAGARFDVATRFSALPQVTSSLIANGFADLVVTAVFDDDSAALEFNLETIESDRRIVSCSSCRVITDTDQNRSSSADVPEIDTALLASTLLQTPQHPTVPVFLDWLSEIVPAIFNAQHALVSTISAVLTATASGDDSPRFETNHSRWHNMPSFYRDEVGDRLLTPGSMGVMRRAALAGQHAFVSDAMNTPSMAKAADLIKRVGYRSILALPMRFNSEAIGIVILYFDDVIRIDDSYVATAQSFVDRCAVRLQELSELATP